MRVLLTGAFGNIGAATLRELLAAGHSVRCFDLASSATRRAARAFSGRCEFFWGDITRAGDVARAVEGQDAVIHDAALIPPQSERMPELTQRVNVDGTRNVVAACEAQPDKPRLIFASSISVFGPSSPDRPPPRRADEPMVATDHYSHSKVAAEQIVRASSLDWIVVRFGATPPEVASLSSERDLEQFFRTDPDNRVEYLHPRDAAVAQANAVKCDEAVHKVMLIGGGESCRIRLRDLNDAYFEASGIGTFPDSAFGKEPYYTDWMDTEESQRLLHFQSHSWEDHRRALMHQLRFVRPFYRLFRKPIRRRMLRSSPYAGAGGGAAP
jgi:nucleoside-diphosphate-sugar epimerase